MRPFTSISLSFQLGECIHSANAASVSCDARALVTDKRSSTATTFPQDSAAQLLWWRQQRRSRAMREEWRMGVWNGRKKADVAIERGANKRRVDARGKRLEKKEMVWIFLDEATRKSPDFQSFHAAETSHELFLLERLFAFQAALARKWPHRANTETGIFHGSSSHGWNS